MFKSFEQAYESLQDKDCGFIQLNHEIDCMIKEAIRSCTGKLDEDSLDAMSGRLVDEAEHTQYEAYTAGFRQAFRLSAWLMMPEQEGLLNERIQTF